MRKPFGSNLLNPSTRESYALNRLSQNPAADPRKGLALSGVPI